MNPKKILSHYAQKKLHYDGVKLLLLDHGFDIIISDGMGIGAVVLSSFYFHDFKNTVLYITLFSLFRKHTEGWHASNKYTCFFLYLSTYFLFELLLVHVICFNHITTILFCLLLLYIAFNSPVEHKNNPLSLQEREKNSRFTNFISILSMILYFLPFKDFKFQLTIFTVVTYNAGLMFLLNHSDSRRIK